MKLIPWVALYIQFDWFDCTLQACWLVKHILCNRQLEKVWLIWWIDNNLWLAYLRQKSLMCVIRKLWIEVLNIFLHDMYKSVEPVLLVDIFGQHLPVASFPRRKNSCSPYPIAHKTFKLTLWRSRHQSRHIEEKLHWIPRHFLYQLQAFPLRVKAPGW